MITVQALDVLPHLAVRLGERGEGAAALVRWPAIGAGQRAGPAGSPAARTDASQLRGMLGHSRRRSGPTTSVTQVLNGGGTRIRARASAENTMFPTCATPSAAVTA